MSDKTGIKLNILMLLVAVMLVALGIQSLVIYRFSSSNKDEAEIEQQKTEVKSDESGKKSAVTKVPKPDENFLNDPFFNMNINDWDPFKEMHSMHERINHMFGNAFGRFEQSDNFKDLFQDYTSSPDMNMEEENDKYIITMDMPGMDESQIKINLEGQTLIVSGEINKSKEAKDDNNSWIMKERHSGSFKRSISLPGPVKADAMTSSTENGVLRIEIPKDSEAATP